jgi:glutamate racemase
MSEDEKDLQAYLARIRKTIADSNSLISQAELRIQETDRMLEKQGLSREQLMQMRFSKSQVEAANQELRRRGLEPLDADDGDAWNAPYDDREESRVSHLETATDDELAQRQKKFGMMMKPFLI